MDKYDLANTCLTIDQLSWSDVDWDIDRVLIKGVDWYLTADTLKSLVHIVIMTSDSEFRLQPVCGLHCILTVLYSTQLYVFSMKIVKRQP